MNTFPIATYDDLAAQCISDMIEVVQTGKFTLEAQVRAYDLLDFILSDSFVPADLEGWFENFQKVYSENAAALENAYDQSALEQEATESMKVYEDALKEARFKAASAESLHLFAKETFEVWQNSGVFMRRRVLKDLRDRAGFKLESHRIGNYVAKTYDLMEEARREFQKAQQESFSANIAYKIKPGLYSEIIEKALNFLYKSRPHTIYALSVAS